MKAEVSAITLGVRDMERAKKFYSALGWKIEQDHGVFVSFARGKASSQLALYTWDALAQDAGVPADGSGFRGVTLSWFAGSDEGVDAVLAEAKRAGGTIVKPAQRAQWGGYSGHFSDPDGYLWKVVSSPTVSE